MTGNVRQTPPEPTCGTLWVTCDNSPTFDGTGPQNAPEGTVDMNSIDNLREYVYDVLTKSAAYAINDMIDEVERDVAELADERDHWMELAHQWEAGASTRGVCREAGGRGLRARDVDGG